MATQAHIEADISRAFDILSRLVPSPAPVPPTSTPPPSPHSPTEFVPSDNFEHWFIFLFCIFILDYVLIIGKG